MPGVCALSHGLTCRKEAVRRLEGEKITAPVELCFNHAELVMAMRIAMGYETKVSVIVVEP